MCIAEPVYRLAEQEWKDFIDEFTTLLTEVDPQIPPLPAKDIVLRIYRDVSDIVHGSVRSVGPYTDLSPGPFQQ